MRSRVFDLRLGRQLLFNGIRFVVERHEGVSDVILRRVETLQTVRHSRNDLAMAAINGLLVDLEAPEPDPKRIQPSFNLSRLTNAQRERALRRLAYTRAALSLHPVGPKSPRLAHTIAEVAKRRKESPPPSAHTVYRWLTRFVLSGQDSTVFLRDAGAVRKRKPRLPEGVEERLRQQLMERLGATKGGSIRGVADEVLAAVAKDLGYDGYKTVRGAVHVLAEDRPDDPSEPDDKGNSS